MQVHTNATRDLGIKPCVSIYAGGGIFNGERMDLLGARSSHNSEQLWDGLVADFRFIARIR